MDGVPDGVPRVPEQRRPDSASKSPEAPKPEDPVASATLRFSVLGPVRASRGDEPITTGSPSNAPCSPPCCCARAVRPPRLS